MDLNSYPIPHPQVAARVVDGSAVVVLADSGEVNVLNAVGTRIWELADGSRSVREIADAIHAEFDVSAQDALRDAETFLEVLLEAKALELQAQPATTE
ncbi:MAG: PqqD family protein [Chloroflexi bacterium]|nr:PqqD family protein [Chloroflexota bacterium]